MSQPCRKEEEDVWRWSALGKNARLVYEALGQQPQSSVAALKSATGLPRRTVERVCRRLADVGLAAKQGTTWEVGPTDLAMVAATLPTAGAGERQRQRHRAQRAQYLQRYDRARRDLLRKDGGATEPPEPVWEEELVVSTDGGVKTGPCDRTRSTAPAHQPSTGQLSAENTELQAKTAPRAGSRRAPEPLSSPAEEPPQ